VRLAWPDLRLAQGALLLGIGVLAVAWRLRERGRVGAISERALRWIVFGASVASAVLSLGWIVEVLRGAPRVIDATTYVLEARIFAGGAFGFEAGDLPTRAAGRFLVRDVAADGAHLAPIFPPGYPAVLAPFVALGRPLALGPLLAAAIPWPTAALARRLARRGGLDDEDARLAAALAALLAAASAALRFHTAETMSHGLGALLGPCALAGSLAWIDRGAAPTDRAAARARAAIALGVGLALGLLVATRPFTGVAFAGACGLVVGRGLDRAGALLAIAGASPGIVLLALHQRATTGEFGLSSQTLYYALADGPSGCFRWGVGGAIGCREEHGPFLARYQPEGFGVLALAGTTARRLLAHATDALNAAPLGALVVLPAVVAAIGAPATRAAALVVPLLMAAYAPFYFDGNLPGGGARLYAEALPVELAIVAAIALGVARRREATSLQTIAAGLVGLSLAGFGVSGHIGHAALRDDFAHEPPLDATRLAEAGISWGIVFVASDHAFNLGFDPRARADAGGLEVARLRGDASDVWLVEARGAPPAFVYVPDSKTGAARLAPWENAPVARLEGESLWPPMAQRGGWVAPDFVAAPCASGRRALAVRRDASGRATIDLALPARLGGHSVRPVWILKAGDVAAAELVMGRDVHARSAPVRGREGCVAGPPLEVPTGSTRVVLRLVSEAGTPALDQLAWDDEPRAAPEPGTERDVPGRDPPP
jgi:hypothetical protein